MSEALSSLPSLFKDESLPSVDAVNIDTLKPADEIYQGTDTAGNLLFRQNITLRPERALPGRSLIALGLTEVCCRVGRGKVLYVPMPEDLSRKGHPGGAYMATAETVWSFYRIPKLIYLPYVWGENNTASWTAMSQADRLWWLNARGGTISLKDIVLPVDLMYDSIERKTFNLNGYIDEDSGAKAMLAIVPKAFLGWSSELQKSARGFEMGGATMNNQEGAWYVATAKQLAEYQVDNAEMIVEKLWDMYFANMSGSLFRYKSINIGLRHFSSKLVETYRRGQK